MSWRYNGSDNVSVFSINAASGALTEVNGSPFPAGQTPLAVEIDDSGKLLYVANSLGKSLSVYSVDSATGKLQLLQMLKMPGFAASIALVE